MLPVPGANTNSTLPRLRAWNARTMQTLRRQEVKAGRIAFVMLGTRARFGAQLARPAISNPRQDRMIALLVLLEST